MPDRLDTRPSLNDRLVEVAARGMRIAKYLAMSFALAVVGGIAIGAVVADNAFVQIFVTFLAAIALWLPILLAALWVDSRLDRWRSRGSAKPADMVIEASAVDASWTRLMRAAPAERERIGAIQRSLANSHLALRDARLDPDAHDLCVLIDRRLPELIDRELDSLPPDDRGRREGVASLVELVEQFARHCGRKRDGRADGSTYEAEVLRRRFEERLAPPPLDSQ
ncbi:MAG: hypothetical protein ABIS39_04155 [Sphingomicrobium sp.]